MRWVVLVMVACGGRPAAETPAPQPPMRATLVFVGSTRIGEPPPPDEPMADMEACRKRLAEIEAPARQRHDERWQAELAALKRERSELQCGEADDACLRRREEVEQRLRNFHEPQFEKTHRCVER